jgi:hypothetical protein
MIQDSLLGRTAASTLLNTTFRGLAPSPSSGKRCAPEKTILNHVAAKVLKQKIFAIIPSRIFCLAVCYQKIYICIYIYIFCILTFYPLLLSFLGNTCIYDIILCIHYIHCCKKRKIFRFPKRMEFLIFDFCVPC